MQNFAKKTFLKSKRLPLFTSIFFIPLLLVIISLSNSGCFRYSFNTTSIPDTIKTVKVNPIDNRARYVNPQLSPRLTDKLRQKITGQTKLTQTNNENADWEISGQITDYSVTTSGVSNQRETTNRLTVSVHITFYNRRTDETKEHDVSRGYDFSANQSLQQAESKLLDEIIRTLTDEIFNRVFSDW
jgi:hypothetical protein